MDFKWSSTLKSSDATVSNNGKTGSIKGGWIVSEENMTGGRYYFEFTINLYSQVAFGVCQAITTATKPTEAQTRIYFSYDGNKAYPRSAYATHFNASNTIGVGVDMRAGEIFFTKDGVNQGVAFNDLKSLGELKIVLATTTSGGNETVTIVDEISKMKYPDIARGFLTTIKGAFKNESKFYSVSNETLIKLSNSSDDTLIRFGFGSEIVNLDTPFDKMKYLTSEIKDMGEGYQLFINHVESSSPLDTVIKEVEE